MCRRKGVSVAQISELSKVHSHTGGVVVVLVAEGWLWSPFGTEMSSLPERASHSVKLKSQSRPHKDGVEAARISEAEQGHTRTGVGHYSSGLFVVLVSKRRFRTRVGMDG